MERQALSILETLIRARYSRQRGNLLASVNTELEVLRFRAAKDLKAISEKAFWHS